MFITDRLDGLKTFGDFKEFVAVFHCQSKKGNELLRAMEPPRHDDFEPERLLTKEEKQKGQKALKGIATWIRDMLKRHAKDPVADVTEIDELKDFFGDEGESDTGKGTEEINPYGDVIIRAKPIRTRISVTENWGGNSAPGSGENSGDDFSDGGSDNGDGGGNGLGGEGNGEGGRGQLGGSGNSGNTNPSDTGSAGGSQKSPFDVNNVRAIPSGSKTRKLAFTPIKSGKIAVHLKEAGADSDYDISVVKSDKGNVSNGGVIVDVEAGNRFVLEIELNQDYSGALKVVAYEIR
jgi:hypothetical protein